VHSALFRPNSVLCHFALTHPVQVLASYLTGTSIPEATHSISDLVTSRKVNRVRQNTDIPLCFQLVKISLYTLYIYYMYTLHTCYMCIFLCTLYMPTMYQNTKRWKWISVGVVQSLRPIIVGIEVSLHYKK
jgi:hypothetical protein